MDNSSFDIIVGMIVLFTTVFGVYKGFISILIDIIAFAVTILLTILAYPYIYSFAGSYLSNKFIISVVSAVLSYVSIFIVLTYFANKLEILLSPIRGGILDRGFGLLVGSIKGLLYGFILYLISLSIASNLYIQTKNLDELLVNLQKNKTIQKQDFAKNSSMSTFFNIILIDIYKYLPKEKTQKIIMPGHLYKNTNLKKEEINK